jgi:hypothetical protein
MFFMRIILILLFTFVDFAYANNVDLKTLENLRIGDKVSDLPQSFESKAFSYDLESKEGKLVGLTIYFNKHAESKKYLKQSEKGYCLIQTSSGDFILNRFFFFNRKLNKRFELTSDYSLKSITIQDMSAAKKHRSCKLKDLVQPPEATIVRKKK